MLLSELVEKYTTYTALRPASVTCYMGCMKTFIAIVGDKNIGELVVEDAIKFREAILGRAKPVTFNNYRRHLVVMINFAIENDWMSVSPFSKIKPVRVLKKPKKTVDLPLIERVLLLLETEESLAEVSPHSSKFHPQWFWRAVVLTFFSTGMRLRQLVELRWKDINFELRQITLRAEGSKNSREWNIPMPALIYDELLNIWGKAKNLSGGKNIMNQQVFNLPLFSKFKRHFVRNETTEENVQAFFKRMSKNLGQPISSHRLRHTTATLLMRRFNDPKAIQILLGHTNLSTTLEYVEVDVATMRKMVDGLTVG